MATAKRVEPQPPPATIVLELTEGEASWLRYLTGSVVDDGNGGEWAKANGSVWRSLRGAGVERVYPRVENPSGGVDLLVLKGD